MAAVLVGVRTAPDRGTGDSVLNERWGSGRAHRSPRRPAMTIPPTGPPRDRPGWYTRYPSSGTEVLALSVCGITCTAASTGRPRVTVSPRT